MPLMTKVGAHSRISSDHYRYMGVLWASLRDPGVFRLGLFGGICSLTRGLVAKMSSSQGVSMTKKGICVLGGRMSH